MMEHLSEVSFLVSAMSIPQNLSFQVGAAEWRCLVSAANAACGIIIAVAIEADVSHLFSGTRSQMSACINAESAHDGQRKPLQKKAF